jgi:hypothetical protein
MLDAAGAKAIVLNFIDPVSVIEGLGLLNGRQRLGNTCRKSVVVMSDATTFFSSTTIPTTVFITHNAAGLGCPTPRSIHSREWSAVLPSLLYLLTSKDYTMLADVAELALMISAAIVSECDMAKSSKPDFLTEERLLACLMFLSKLRKSGVTNMFEIRLKLRHAVFPFLSAMAVSSSPPH